MNVDRSDLLSWSFFQLTPDDEVAIGGLCRSSLLSLPDRAESRLVRDLKAGTKVALSFRDLHTNEYIGLCVFGLESPSPLGDKALSLFVLTPDVYVPPQLMRSRHRSDTRTHLSLLLGEIRRFCRTHGFTRVQCYAPDDNDALDQLIREGFRFESAISIPRGQTFGLSMQVEHSYTGDPYDGKHLLHWMADELGLEVRSDSDTALSGQLRLESINDIFKGTRFGELAIPVDMSLQSDAPRGLTVAFGAHPSASPRPIQINEDDLRRIAQTPTLNMSFWPPPADGASIAVEIRNDLFANFKDGAISAFFDSGSYGTLLDRALQGGDAPYIFFVDVETASQNPRLIGFARVVSVHRDSPDRLWEEWGHVSSWSSPELFARYRAIKRKMTVIVFDRLVRRSAVGVGLPVISHSWTYVPSQQAYRIARDL